MDTKCGQNVFNECLSRRFELTPGLLAAGTAIRLQGIPGRNRKAYGDDSLL
jgi:hypothetical protein